MINRLKNVLFVICIVMVFTGQSNGPQEEKQHVTSNQARPQAASSAPVAQHVSNNQARPPQAASRSARQPQYVVGRKLVPQQAAAHQAPPVQVQASRPSYQQRLAPRVYAVSAPAPVENNRFLNRQHHKNWQPLYNFYDNQYHFYPYVNVASNVELSAGCVTVLFDGQAYYYDRGTFYQQDAQGYLAVAPPIGIIVNMLPPHARQIVINGQIYYRYKGIFYIQVVPQGFQVVGPAVLSVVEE